MTPSVVAAGPATVLALLGTGAGVGWWAFEKSKRRTRPVPPGYRDEIRLPHEYEFELYHNAFSLCSMKTRVCLAELGIRYASHPIDLIETGSYETLSRRFLSVNPGGTVPVLVHHGHPIYESHEQIRHAAAHAPAGRPSLVPDEPDEREAMERWVDRSSITQDPIGEAHLSAGNAVAGLTFPLFATMIGDIPTPRILEGLLFHFDKRRPAMFLAFKLLGLERMPALPRLPDVVRNSQREMGRHLDALEAQLGQHAGPWILGDAFTLADVGWLVIFERLAQVDSLHLFAAEGRRPACAAYWEALRKRPSHAEAIAAHAHPLVERGRERLLRAKAAHPAVRALLEDGIC